MPAESRLTDEEIVLAVILRKDSARGYKSIIAAVLAKLEDYPHRQQAIEDARRIEQLVADRMRGMHCEGCHVPNICRGFLGDDEKGGDDVQR